MGLMDKVKAQATTLAQKTQETANAGMAKFDSSQQNRRSDPLLRSLGLAILAERTGRGTSETPAQIDRLIADLTAHEAQNNVNLVLQATQVQQMQMGPGDFLSSSEAAVDPNVSAAPPGGDPAYGGAPGYGGGQSFGSAPTSFPQTGGQTGFPDAGQAASFPGAAPSGFPGAAPAGPAPSGFPGAAPAGPAPSGFPAAAPSGFPEATPATSFPGAAPAGFPGAPDATQTPPEPDPGPAGFPPASGS